MSEYQEGYPDEPPASMPAAGPAGEPACPVCQSPLRFVRRLIVRAEHSVVGAEVDATPPGGPFLMPVVEREPGVEDIVEYLDAHVECAGLECGYRLEGERVGDAEWAI